MLTAQDQPIVSKTKMQLQPLSFDDLSLDEPKALQQEPLLVPNSKRFVLFPIQYHDIWQHYKNSEAKFWPAEDIEFSDDAQGCIINVDFEKLSGREQSLVMQMLSVLTINDALMGQSVVSKISTDIQSPEARCFYGFQIMQRNIHTEVLTFALDLLVKEGVSRDDMLEAAQKMSAVQAKVAWVQRYLTDSAHPISMRLVSLAIYNSIVQNAMYDIIFYLSQSDEPLLQGLVHGIAKIRHDHQHYFESTLILQRSLVNTPSVEQVHAMVADAVRLEHQMVDELKALCGGTLSLVKAIPVKELKQRQEALADEALMRLGFPALFKVQDPLRWISSFADKEAKRFEAVEEQVVQQTFTPKKALETGDKFTIDEDF